MTEHLTNSRILIIIPEVTYLPRGMGNNSNGLNAKRRWNRAKRRGPGTGRGMGLRKGGRGHGGGFGAGPDGSCICPNCGEKVPHQLGTPCYEQQCPKCGTAMTRK